MKGSLYRSAILKPQSKFVFPAVEMVSYASLFTETWITLIKQWHLGSIYICYVKVCIEVMQNLKFTEG